MKDTRPVTWLFSIAAAYDGLLGLLFLFAPTWLFQHFAVPPPNHMGYIQFPAALLIVFALMFVSIARAPRTNRNLIIYGVLLKLSYCGVTAYNWLTIEIAWIWKPFVLLDLVFLVLFLLARKALGDETPEPRH